MATGSDAAEVLDELHLVDHRHGEEHSFMLRLTSTHLSLTPLRDDGEDTPPPPPPGLAARLLGNLRAATGQRTVRDPHPLLETDFRIDDNGVRIRLGSLNASYSYTDFDRQKARSFLVSYLKAKRELT